MAELSNHPAPRLPQRPSTVEWMGLALLGGLMLVLFVEFTVAAKDQLPVALRWTARWSFVWFCLASWSSALGALCGPRLRPLAVRAREFGLAFASAHAVHVVLVAILLYSATTPFPRRPLVFFGVGAGFVYVMALITVSARLRQMLGSDAWRMFRAFGIEYINFAYYSDFSARTFHKGLANFLVYAPFLALTVAGPAVRLAALIHKSRAAGGARRSAAKIAITR